MKFNEPFLTGDEKKYIKDVFKRKYFSGNGYYTKKCQELIKNKISANKVLLTDSCTSALEISALLMRDWDKEQEVILPSYTFSTTASSFLRTGYKLIFADIDTKTMMIDIKDVKKKITKKTTAIIIVHYGGLGVDVQKFRHLCDQESIYLIEDAAQAFGCYEDGKAMGTIGDLGCFSFHETKNLHAGLAGALIINNSKFEDRATYIWERGTNREEVLKGLADKYSWVEVGGSFYPTELQAAFLYAQLEGFEKNITERKYIFEGYYNTFLSASIKDFSFSQIKNNFITNYHAFWIILASTFECDYVREKLSEYKISAYIGYVPLHSSKVGKKIGYKADDLKITEEYSKRLLRLPFHNNMKKQDSIQIAKLVIQLITNFRK